MEIKKKTRLVCKFCETVFESERRKIFCCERCCDKYHDKNKKQKRKTYPNNLLPGEIWKDINELGGVYQISNLGRLRSKKSRGKLRIKENENEFKIIKAYPDKDGYLKVCLIHNGYKNILIHRIVAIYFVDNHLEKPEVNHIDGVKSNNKFDNLEWCTRRENQIHAIKNKLQPVSKGSQRGRSAKLNESLVSEIKERLRKGEKYNEIHSQYKVSPATIYDIYKNKTWTHVK